MDGQTEGPILTHRLTAQGRAGRCKMIFANIAKLDIIVYFLLKCGNKLKTENRSNKF